MVLKTLSLAALGLSLAATVCLAAETPGGGKAAKVSLRPQYLSGSYVCSQSTEATTELTVEGKPPAEMKVSAIYAAGVEVAPPAADGSITLKARYRQVLKTVSAAGKTSGLDSTGAVSPPDPDMTAVLDAVMKFTSVLRVAPDGHLVGINGPTQFLDSLAKEKPELAKAIGPMRGEVGNEKLVALVLEEPSSFPARPVGVGDEWKVDVQVPFASVGQVTLKKAFRLKALDPGPAGQVAVIGLTVESVPVEASRPAAGKAQTRDLVMKHQGEIRFNLKLGRVEQGSVAQQCSFTILSTGRDGNPETATTKISTQWKADLRREPAPSP